VVKENDPDIGEAKINLAAAIQVLSAVTVNIGCIAGADVAFDAVESVMAGRAEIETLIGAMRKLTPSDFPPPPEAKA
jgi:acetyl-CoA acetyltransferase